MDDLGGLFSPYFWFNTQMGWFNHQLDFSLADGFPDRPDPSWHTQDQAAAERILPLIHDHHLLLVARSSGMKFGDEENVRSGGGVFVCSLKIGVCKMILWYILIPPHVG